MRTLLTLFAVLSLCLVSLAENTNLPFGVSLGGQQAVETETSDVYAIVENPVAAGAQLAVKGVQGQIIVNIFPSNDKGEATQGAQPLILLFDAGESKSISDNMQGSKVTPGWYLTNVVGGGKTSRVLFQVK